MCMNFAVNKLVLTALGYAGSLVHFHWISCPILAVKVEIKLAPLVSQTISFTYRITWSFLTRLTSAVSFC